MSKKSIQRNYIYTVGFQVLTLVIPLITTPYISRVLEPDGIGYYSFYNSLCSYFVLFATMGTTPFGQREISFFQDNKHERSKVLWENVTLRSITAITATVFWWFYMVQTKNIDKVFLGILSLNILGIPTDISWFFQGMEEFGKTVGRSALFKVLNVILIFLLVKNKSDLALYVFLSVGLNLLSNLVLWSYLPQYICKIRLCDLNPFRNIKTILSLFIPSIAIQIYTVLDKTMIGLMSDASYENGYYEQAANLSKMVLSLVNAMVIVLAPRTGYYYKTNNKEKLDGYIYQSYQFVWFLAVPLCLGLIGITSNFVPWFYGEKYNAMIPVLRIASILILVIGLNYVTGAQYLIPTQQQNKYTMTVIVGAMSNFVINLFLIPRYFALGAIYASVIAETLILILQLFMVRKNFNIKTIISFSKKKIVAGFGMLIVVFWEDKYLAPSCFSTILLVISGGIAYIVILLLQKDAFLNEIIYTLKRGESLK